MVVALEEFVKSLEDLGIVSPSNLRSAQVKLPPEKRQDVQELARELVRWKKLTKFQAQEVCLGRATTLVLGNYTILDRIGQGGMGQVFKAQHRRMDRIVAIKMLPARVTKDNTAAARFEREVKAAAKLRHPNIVAADDADEANGVHFLVMEYVDGPDLSALVKSKGPLPVDQALNCVLQAARGLEYAHRHGVVHRDIKPGNLLLDGEGTVKVLDMGLARLENASASELTELTGTGQILGAVEYMSPEQALDTKHADERSDIYSLGCTLWYLLTGRAAFGGESVMARLLAHREQPVPSLREARPDAPPFLEAVFEKMVAKQPGDRYASMSEVIADLERCRGGEPAAQIAPAPLGAADEDSRLQEFFRAIEFTGRSSAATKTAVAEKLAAQELAASLGMEGNAAFEATRSGSGPQTERILPGPAPPRPAAPRSAQERGWRTRCARNGLIAAGGATVLLFLTVVFFVETNEGTIRVEIDDPQIEVAIKGTEIVLKQADRGRDVRLSTGEKTLVVERGNVKFETDRLILKKDETVTVLVTFVAGRLQARQAGQLIGQGPVPAPPESRRLSIDYAAERRAAEWLSQFLNNGDMVLRREDRGSVTLTPDARNIPRQRFAVERIQLQACGLDDDGLARLGACRRLTHIALTGMPRVTCAGLEHLRQATALEHLSLDGTGVDDRIWPLIARWPKLERLSLADCRIVDPPPDPLRPLPSLKSLVVSFTNMTDAGLLTIAGRCPNLLELGIAQNEKQNLRSLAPLRGFPRLTTVFCSSDQLTQEGVDVLAANTRIDELRVFGPWDDSMFERLAPLRGQLKRFAVQASGLLATAPTSRAYERLAKFSGLADVSLQGEQGSPCDADLDVLARLPRLKTLALAFPETPSDAKSSAAVRRYTPAGIEALRKARPDVRLLIDGNEYAADPEAVAAAGKNIDRRVAEHVLALGGTMQLLYRPHGRYAAQIGDLPSDSFKIANISLPNAQLLHGEHIALIGQLRHPRSLDLTGTPLLNGDLEHIGKLETLRWLRISSTKVTDEGLVALKPLERLTYLNLEGIKVTARGMEAIGELSHLEELLLGNASVSDDGLAQLHGLKRLRSLNLANARITDAGLKHLAGLTDLENLDLTGTRINGSGLGHLATLPRLDTLILTNSAVKDEHVKELPSLAALHEVALAGTRLTDAAVDALSQVKALANIDLGGTLVTEEGRERLGGALTTSNLNRQHVDATRAAATWMLESGGKVNYVKRVAELPAAPFEIFNVNFAWLKTTDDAAIVHLAGLSNLRDLNISGVTITGQVRLLQGAPRLRFLATSNNQQLTDDWFDALAGCALLRVLSLDGTNVSAANFAKLRELLLVNVTLGGATDQILAVLPKARLTHLACGLTPGVSDVGLEHLREATEIELLDLYSNYSVTDAGLQGLKGLRQLRHLNLAGTRLFGEGLEHLSEQKQLELLGLGGTRVDDEHLAALSQLDRLCSLGLAGTEITDAGLEHLKTLDDLDVLYLQQTQVTERGVARLQAALPHCRIVSNFAPETP